MTATTPRPVATRRTCATSACARRGQGLARQSGWTLVDLMIVACLLAWLAGSAMAALQSFAARQTLAATAALLETDLRYARSVALANDVRVRLQVQVRSDGSTCYVVHTGPAGSCQCGPQGQATCTAEGQSLRVAEQVLQQGVRIQHSGQSLVFAAGKGTVTPSATLVVRTAAGDAAIHQVVNIMGRTRSCSPQKLSGLPTCA